MRLATSTSTFALLAAASAKVAEPAFAQVANVTTANVNVLNLLSPFLDLNASS